VIDWLDELTADCPKDIARNTNNHAVRAVAHWLYQNVPSITTCRRLVMKARI
jgi:O6-methylguanine-DNA--protein-cysteine methyltransferase